MYALIAVAMSVTHCSNRLLHATSGRASCAGVDFRNFTWKLEGLKTLEAFRTKRSRRCIGPLIPVVCSPGVYGIEDQVEL